MWIVKLTIEIYVTQHS